jgi:toxin ParE1/3/4
VAEVRWRPQALRDLEAAEEYYKAVAPDFAGVFMAGAFEKVSRLAEFPRMGRPVPEIGEESIREVLYRQYRIVYVVEGDAVEVLTVFHSARQFGGLG